MFSCNSKHLISPYSVIRNNYILLLSTFGAGLLFYIFPICHYAITLDNEGHITNTTFYWYITSKRWGICLFQKLFFLRTLIPSFWIVANLMFLSLAALFMVDTLNLKKSWHRYVFLLLFITYPQYSYMMQFACTADAVGVGIFLVSLGFWYFTQGKTWLSLIVTYLCFTLSLSIYISIIFIPMTLILVSIFSEIIELRSSLKKIIGKLVILGIITGISYLTYEWISRMCIAHYQVADSSEYFSNMNRWKFDSPELCVKNIISSISHIFKGKGYIGNLIWPSVFIPFIILAIHLFKEKIAISYKCFGVCLLLFSLLAPFFQIVLLGKDQPGRVFLAQGVLFAAMWSISLKWTWPKIKPDCIFTGLFFLFIFNGYRVSRFFYSDMLMERTEKNFVARIMVKIDDLGVNLADTPIIICGYSSVKPEFHENEYTFNASSMGLLNIKNNHWRRLTAFQVWGFCNDKLTLPSPKLAELLLPDIKKMPVFPAKGSVELIKGVVVVKLGNDFSLSDYPDWVWPK